MAAQTIGLTNTGKMDDALVSSGHYFAAIPDLASAQAYARRFNVIIENITKFGSFPDDMIIANPKLVIGMYGKGIESQVGADGTFPDNFYAHTSTGARINVFNSTVWMMQADHSVGTPYSDSRGFTANTWKEWRAKDVWKDADTENAKYSNDPFVLGYLDSLSATSGLSGAKPVSWQDGHVYSADEFHGISYTVGDETINREAIGGRYTFANGLKSGSNYFPIGTAGKTSDMPPHVDGAVAESWLRDNGSPLTSFPNEARWITEVNLLVHMSSLSKYCWVVCDINNPTAGGSGFTPTPTTPAGLAQWRRYSIATFLIGNNGYGLYEFVESTSLQPWTAAWDFPIYHVDLGAPLDTWGLLTAGGVGFDAARGVYYRRYTNGCVYVNVSGSSKTFTGDRTYKNYDGTALPGNSITVPNNDGAIVLTTGVTPPSGGTTVSPLVIDTFSRTVAAGGLGTADTGQVWKIASHATDYSIDGTKAIINVPVSQGHQAYLDDTALVKQDAEASIQFNMSELAIGGNQVNYIWLRGDVPGNNAYRLQINLTPTPTVTWLMQTLLANVAATASGASVVTESFTPNVASIINAKFRATGINPTTLQAKVWLEGTAEPDWEQITTDSAAALQAAGYCSFTQFVAAGNTNAPLNWLVYHYTYGEVVTTPPPPVTSNDPPNVVVTSPPNAFTIAADASGKASIFNVVEAVDPDPGDSVVKVTVSINGGTEQNIPFDSASSSYKKTLNLTPGSYSILNSAYDTLGNVGQVTTTFTITPYVVPPPPAAPAAPPSAAIGTPGLIEEFTIVYQDHNGRSLGEVKGSDLRFGKYVKGTGFMSFQVHKKDPLSKPSILEALALDYSVRRNGVELQAGEITDVDRDTDDEIVSVAGRDWKHYLESLPLPFDPSASNPDSQNYHSGTTAIDVVTIVESLATKVLDGYPNSIDITVANQMSGILQTANFLAADGQNLREMIDSLANQSPGFEWEVTPDQRLIIYAPTIGTQSELVLDNSNIKGVHYSEQGVTGTILWARGSGNGSSQLQEIRKNPVARKRYRDRVVIIDYGNLASRSALSAIADKELANVSTQMLEFWVTMYPNGEDVWSMARDGDTIYVNWQDESIQLDGYYRCTGYETYVDQDGNSEVVYHFDANLDVSSE